MARVLNRSAGGVRKKCAAPMTINSGGTFTGGVESTNPATAAVVINTTSAVTLNRMLIRHAGIGVRTNVNSTNLTITNCVFQRLNPGTANDGRAVRISQAAQVVIENNRLLDGNGIYWLGDVITPTVGRVRFNHCVNVGRYKNGHSELVQFLQLDKVTLGGFEIAWNHTQNHHGVSEVEDNINLYQAHGTSGNRIDVHHNLIDGAYDTSSDGDGYTGGGIICGDGVAGQGGSWTMVRDNWFVGTSNYGGSIFGGSNNTLQDNHAVSDCLTQAGVLHSPTFGTGFMAWDGHSAGGMTNIVVQNNTGGWIRRTGVGSNTERSDFWLPEADTDTGNGSLGTVNAAAEQAARDAWNTARVSAGVTVGPVAP